jgi:hypothetical protein
MSGTYDAVSFRSSIDAGAAACSLGPPELPMSRLVHLGPMIFSGCTDLHPRRFMTA